jgi:hypothetical protein
MQRVSSLHRKLVVPAILTVCLISLFATPSCKKEEDEARVLTTRDKILGTWRRSLRGYDHNANGRIDSLEVYTAPATDTVTLTLVPNASYTRIQRFKGADISETGTWHLQQNDAEVVFQPSTSTSRVDTCRLDSVSQAYFMKHTAYPNIVHYYEAFTRPN